MLQTIKVFFSVLECFDVRRHVLVIFTCSFNLYRNRINIIVVDLSLDYIFNVLFGFLFRILVCSFCKYKNHVIHTIIRNNWAKVKTSAMTRKYLIRIAKRSNIRVLCCIPNLVSCKNLFAINEVTFKVSLRPSITGQLNYLEN